jgi:hypothetical protein
VVGTGETAEIAAGGGQQLGAQQWTYAGHAGDHCGEFVLPKPVCNELVQRVDLLVEADHLQHQVVDYLSDRALARKLCVLPLSGLNCGGSQGFSVADVPIGY